MKLKVVVLGAGFGGLELATILSEALGENLDLTLIDKSDAFVFGFSKLDVMFGRHLPETVRLPYSAIAKPGVTFRQETILSIDPEAKRVVTNAQAYHADILVVALGADYDVAATPGLAEGGNEFYSVAGAFRLREVLQNFRRGHAVIGVTSTPFKCPPAPSETSLMLHDYLVERGVREDCEITFVMPFSTPIPPSPESCEALLSAFRERGITFMPDHRVQSLDPARQTARLDDGTELPYDLFLGVPKHCAPPVVVESGLTESGWIPVSPQNLMTRFPGVYAVGDVTTVGTPKAGVFAEGAARVAAKSILAGANAGEVPAPYAGAGTCYIEFGAGRVGRVDVNFLAGASVTGTFFAPSEALVAEKEHFGSSRRARWFGL